MGTYTAGGAERGRAYTGKLVNADTRRTISGADGNPVPFSGKCNLTLSGTWTGSAALERSFDGGTNWHNCTLPDGTANSYTANVSVVFEEPEPGVIYALNPSVSTGTLNYRFSWA
jgi:hypothetical protein